MKMTIERYEARVAMYNEAIDHMETCIHSNTLEVEEAKNVQKQIITLRNAFRTKWFKKGLFNTVDIKL